MLVVLLLLSSLLNFLKHAAKVYGVDLKKKLKAFPQDTLTKFKSAYIENGGQSDNAAYGWVKV